jgi:ArsR family transcriptional regulator
MTDSLQPERCARLLRALADPERLRIINCLRDGPRNVGEIAACVGDQVVNVSHHLGVLRHAGVVQDEKQGRFVVYRLHPDVFRPADDAPGGDHLDLGCCRLQIPAAKDDSA